MSSPTIRAFDRVTRASSVQKMTLCRGDMIWRHSIQRIDLRHVRDRTFAGIPVHAALAARIAVAQDAAMVEFKADNEAGQAVYRRQYWPYLHMRTMSASRRNDYPAPIGVVPIGRKNKMTTDNQLRHRLKESAYIFSARQSAALKPHAIRRTPVPISDGDQRHDDMLMLRY